MRESNFSKRGVALLGCIALVAAGLVFAPLVGLCASKDQVVAAEKQGAKSQRSYYFSRTRQPYESYEEWLKANPRNNHPYHDTVHGPLFSTKKSSDPQVKEANTKPLLNQPAFKTRPKYRYGSQRILWVNDRYYSGKYYPTAKKNGESK